MSLALLDSLIFSKRTPFFSPRRATRAFSTRAFSTRDFFTATAVVILALKIFKQKFLK